jgi:hypothetical protein
MLTIHDPFTPQLRNRLKTIGMGLGLVRLLQDAGRTEEARTTLAALANRFQAPTTKGAKKVVTNPMPIACLGHHVPCSELCPSL